MAAHIPHCEVEVFRDGDHFVAAKQPSRFNRTVIEFLLGEIISMKFIKAGKSQTAIFSTSSTSARSRSSKAAWTSSICPSARRIFSRESM